MATYNGSAASAVGFGAFVGSKYFFSPKTGVYAKLGYQSLSFLNVGLAFSFKDLNLINDQAASATRWPFDLMLK
jgi:hypothetical protein